MIPFERELFDHNEKFQLSLFIEGHQALEIEVSLDDLISSWNGVSVENKEKASIEFNKALRYDPFNGKTYNEIGAPHPKGCKKDEIVYQYQLHGFSLQEFEPQIFLKETQWSSLYVAIVPVNLFSLLVKHEVESHPLWLKFLENIGFFKSTRPEHSLYEIIPPFYTFIEVTKNSDCFFTSHNAILTPNYSFGDFHSSIKIGHMNWCRIKKDFSVSDLSSYFDVSGGNPPQFQCDNIEELKFGFAKVQVGEFNQILINTYNQIVLESNTPTRYFFYFTPHYFNDEYFVIATRIVQPEQLEIGESFLDERTYYWNILSIRTSKWMFKSFHPKGLAVWTTSGIIIGCYSSSQSAIAQANEKQSIESILNETNFRSYYQFVELRELENLIINQRLVNDISSFDPFHQKIDRTIVNLPTSVPSELINDRERAESIDIDRLEESRNVEALDDLNRQFWDEMNEIDPDWPYD